MALEHNKKDERFNEECSERTPLIKQLPTPVYEYEGVSYNRYMRAELTLPYVRRIAGIILGMVLLAVVLILVAEVLRKSHQPDPFMLHSPISTEFINHMNEEFLQAWTQGEDLVAYRKKFEKSLFENGLTPKKETASSLLQHFRKADVDENAMINCAIVVENMKRTFRECINATLLPDRCKPRATSTYCNASYPYRSYNGSCNNLKHADWGMAMTAFKRLLRPIYADGVSAPRTAISGGELPSARYLTNELYSHHSYHRPPCNCTMLTAYFGLFVDHDMIKIGCTAGHKGASISCCDSQVLNNPALLHPECMAIRVPENDPFYGPLGVTCLSFVRSAAVPGKCPGEREQMNIVTSFIDASGVYGSFDDENKALRSFKNGLLNVYWINHTAMLPQNRNTSNECGFPDKNLYCFKAGDMRVNEQVELTAMHTIWMREHNRIAVRLQSLNPHWDDEKLFQESRRILIAELQHITYNEFLPLLLGDDVVKNYNLTIDPHKGYEGYNPESNPSIYNVFGAAAFRVGHTLIEGTIDLIGPDYVKKRGVPLHTTFFNPHIFYENGMDLLLRGLVIGKASSVDSYVTDEIRNRLFQPHNGHYGSDLSAIGIQRGRDHGIPGYIQWRKFCGLPEVNSWEDLFNFMNSKNVQRLRKAYIAVEDIDLKPAALSEYHLPGALVGPVHACLIARQFHQTRFGDRFWFEAQRQAGSFSPGQLEEIYKSNLARLICDNSDDLQKIQKFPMRSINSKNPLVKCSEIPEVNLKVWTEA